MSGTVSDWFQRLMFTKIQKSIVNFNLVESEQEYSFMGVVQPASAQALMVKPEGQRSWKWYTVHAWPALVLAPDEIIMFLGVRYRVMEKLDYTPYGYVEYQIVQDYSKAGT